MAMYCPLAEVRSSEGTVSLDAVHGSLSVELEGPGNIAARRVSGSLQAKVAGPGKIEVDFDSPSGSSRLETSDGPVSLTVSHQALARVNLSAPEGRVTVAEGATFTGDASDTIVSGFLLPDAERAELEGTGGQGKGKIDLKGAEQFSLTSSFFSPSAGSATGSDLADISVAMGGRGTLLLESLSWMDSIKRKFDLS